MAGVSITPPIHPRRMTPARWARQGGVYVTRWGFQEREVFFQNKNNVFYSSRNGIMASTISMVLDDRYRALVRISRQAGR